LVEDFQELVTVSRAAQEWKPAIAVAGDEVQMLMSVAPVRLLWMMQDIYQVKYCSVIIRLVQGSRTMGAAV
jgi:hypothetical protein